MRSSRESRSIDLSRPGDWISDGLGRQFEIGDGFHAWNRHEVRPCLHDQPEEWTLKIKEAV